MTMDNSIIWFDDFPSLLNLQKCRGCFIAMFDYQRVFLALFKRETQGVERAGLLSMGSHGPLIPGRLPG